MLGDIPFLGTQGMKMLRIAWGLEFLYISSLLFFCLFCPFLDNLTNSTLKLIKPAEIAAQIMTLIDEADEKVIIVSPYYKIGKWYKLNEHLKRLFARDIDVQFFVREGVTESIEELEAFGIIPYTIPNLHCKLYMNEKQGIVATMNLTQSSDISSLDIGYISETVEEFKELNDFYTRYIQPHQNSDQQNETGEKLNFFDVLEGELTRQHPNYRIRSRDTGPFVRYEIGGRTFDFEFESENGNEFLIVRSILPEVLYDFLKPKENQLQESIDNELFINSGGDGNYSILICPYKLSPKYINHYSNQQIRDLVDKIIKVPMSFFEMIEGSGNAGLRRYL